MMETQVEPSPSSDVAQAQEQQLPPVTPRGENGSAASAPSTPDHLSMFVSPERKMMPGSDALLKLKQAAASYRQTPSIYVHTSPEEEHKLQESLENKVPDWEQVLQGRSLGVRRDLKYAFNHLRSGDPISRQSVQKVSKVTKTKGVSSGRTYTSQYRGVHQTFPTKRWEAQFRRNGKPTSLGCFDEEKEAARAYDKMMIWCELHHAQSLKAGITNFDTSHYEKEIAYLSRISQDQLTQELRQDGRNQAAKRTMRQKREGQIGVSMPTGYTTP